MLTGWTGTLLRALDDRGVDVEALLDEVGIDPALLADPERRVALDASTRLWLAAERITGDDAFGIDVSRYVTPATFHGLGQAFTTSTSLRAALDRVARFARVTADDSVVTAEVIGREYVYVNGWRRGETRPADMAVVATMAAIVRGARSMLGRSFAPASVDLRQEPPDNLERFEQFFACPVSFGADEHRMRFGLDDAERNWPGAHERLAALADGAVESYLSGLADRVDVGGGDDATLAATVAGIVADALAAGDPDVESVARELAVSSRTLQRRLGDEGTTFREVVAVTRRRVAERLLAETDMSVTQIGRRLGFSETAAFSRAFRRWTGSSPAAWRRGDQSDDVG